MCSSDLWSSRYTPESEAWSTAEIIGKVTSDRASSFALPQIELDANGDALAMWVENPGSAARVWSTRYRAASRQWVADH